MPNAQNLNMSELFSDIEKQIVILAETTVSKFKHEAVADGNNLVETVKEDVIRWGILLSAGQLKIKEFEFLMGTEKEFIKMTALEHAGLAQKRISVFFNGVMNVVIDVSLKKIVGNDNDSPLT